MVLHSYKLTRFSNIILYNIKGWLVLHSYKLTRFSNSEEEKKFLRYVLHSYKLTRFSNPYDYMFMSNQFYTLTNLQGSQTSNEIITEPKHTGICVSHLVMYKTQIFIYQLIIFTFQTFTLASLNQQQIYFTIKRCFVQFL